MTQPPTDSARGVGVVLRELEAHHVEQNHMKGRPEERSKTLRLVREAIDSLQSRPVGGVEGVSLANSLQASVLGAIREARMHMAGGLNSAGCREITDRRLEEAEALLAAHFASPPHMEPVSGGEDLRLLKIGERFQACDLMFSGGVWKPIFEHWIGNGCTGWHVPVCRPFNAPVCDRVAGEGEAIRALLLDALERAFRAGRNGDPYSAAQDLRDEAVPLITAALTPAMTFADAARWRHARHHALAELLSAYPTTDTSDTGLDYAVDVAIASTLAPAALNGGRHD